MTTRSASRRFSPQLPSRSNIAVALASAAAGITIGIAAGSRYWDGEQSISSVASFPQTTTNVAAGAGVTNDLIQPSAQERKLSPTGVNGFRDFDPDLVVPNASAAAAAKDLTPFYESIADLSGDVAASVARKLSPTGATGFRDFDPDVTYGSAGLTGAAIQPSGQERKLSPTGRTGLVDFDPAVRYTNE